MAALLSYAQNVFQVTVVQPEDHVLDVCYHVMPVRQVDSMSTSHEKSVSHSVVP